MKSVEFKILPVTRLALKVSSNGDQMSPADKLSPGRATNCCRRRREIVAQ